MLVIGVDPGLKGGVSLLSESRIIEVHPMPSLLIKKSGAKNATPVLDIPGIANLLAKLAGMGELVNGHPEVIVYVEWNNPRPGNASQASFSCGQQFIFEMACYLLKIPMYRLPSQTWTKKYGFKSKEASGEKAEVSRRYQKLCQLFPQPEIIETLKGPRGGFTNTDGQIDSVFIAHQHFLSKNKAGKGE